MFLFESLNSVEIWKSFSYSIATVTCERERALSYEVDCFGCFPSNFSTSNVLSQSDSSICFWISTIRYD